MHPIIASSGEYLVISTLDGCCLVYTNKESTNSIPIIIKSKPVTDKAVDDVAKGIVLYATFSHCSKYLAICNDYKQMLLYSVDSEQSPEWTLVSSRSTPKKGVKLEFLKDDSLIIMADKFGDITSFSVPEPEKEGEIILGHLSMLLDCTFVCGGKYLVSADRDEKIRVSCYPNTYNIQAFCLGHTKYVTSIIAAENWLVSGGGDGLVKLWDPTTGCLLSEIVCSEENKVVQQVLYMKKSSCIVCLIAGSTKLVVVSIKFSENAASLEQEVSEKKLPAPALTMRSYFDDVVVLLNCKDQPLHLVRVSSDDVAAGGDTSSAVCSIGRDITSRWHSFSEAYDFQTKFFANLTKLSADNVDEELVRKGKRVNATSENNETKTLKH